MAMQPFGTHVLFRAFVVAAALVAGCSTLPQPPREQVRYDLGLAPAATVPAAAALPPLTVADVQISVMPENSTLMLYRLAYANAQELRPYQQARWAQPPSQLVQQRLRLLLAGQRPLLASMDNVAAARTSSPALLKVDIEDFSQIFDAEKSSRGVVQLRATLIGRDAAGATVLLGQKAFGVQVPAPSADAAGGARAIAMATDQALQQLNGWLMAQGR